MIETKILFGDAQELGSSFNMLSGKLDTIIAFLEKGNSSPNKQIYSDAEAAKYLRMSTKKLQSLRNARKIGFIRENGGRKILYCYEHLLEYLKLHELKKRK